MSEIRDEVEPADDWTPLRERKKLQTRRDLSNAAYEVIRDHGVAALSADAVAQRAGVSRRTLFNYFPTVEAALVPVVEEFLDEMSRHLADSELDGAPLASLARIVREFADPELLERFAVIGMVSARSTVHHGLLHQCSRAWLDAFVDLMRPAIGSYAGPCGDLELYLHGIAQGLAGAAEASTRVWLMRTGGEITPETIAVRQQLLADAFDQLGAGFDPTP